MMGKAWHGQTAHDMISMGVIVTADLSAVPEVVGHTNQAIERQYCHPPWYM